METENAHDPNLQHAETLAKRYASIWSHAFTAARDTINSRMPDDPPEPNQLGIPTRHQRDVQNAANHIAYMVLDGYIHRPRPKRQPETPAPPAGEPE